jgi:hypothetical protein
MGRKIIYNKYMEKCEEELEEEASNNTSYMMQKIEANQALKTFERAVNKLLCVKHVSSPVGKIIAVC